MQYKILQANGGVNAAHDLEEKVTAHLVQGWEPHGVLSVLTWNGKILYTQAVVLHEKKVK